MSFSFASTSTLQHLSQHPSFLQLLQPRISTMDFLEIDRINGQFILNANSFLADRSSSWPSLIFQGIVHHPEPPEALKKYLPVHRQQAFDTVMTAEVYGLQDQTSCLLLVRQPQFDTLLLWDGHQFFHDRDITQMNILLAYQDIFSFYQTHAREQSNLLDSIVSPPSPLNASPRL